MELFPLLKEKGGHNMETANCEPIPAAAQQDLTGSKTADLSVIYDSEDANYCALVDELVRGIESMPFVSKLNQVQGERPGFQASLTCYAAREYDSCRCKQGNISACCADRTALHQGCLRSDSKETF